MKRQILFLLASLGAGIGLGLWLGSGVATEGPHATTDEADLVYRCAMHPTVIAEGPGSCPICDMDLVADKPAPASGELTSTGTVTIDPVTVQNIGVRTAPVAERTLQRSVRTVGRVDYDETRMADVNTKVAGWVEALFVDFTGQEVTKGQPLLELYSPELVAAQEEYLTALAYLERLEAQPAGDDVQRGARELLEASAQRLRYWDVSEEQIAALRQQRRVRRTLTVHSPQEGIVVHKAVFDGAHIDPGQHLYRIAEVSEVWVYADVYEYELPWVKTGQEALVTLSYLPGRTFRGEVTHIYPFLDKKTRTVKVRMSFDNTDRQLKPEMYANVSVRSEAAHERLAVPVESVIHSGERTLAVVSLGEGRFQPREVEVGVQADGYYEILSGLHGGERIVTSAQFLIDSESNLKAAVSAMSNDGDTPSVSAHEH
jgi:Cu(I)/Ag(I) efflux system membrane fusion protein/cobalt-zinc-cadmium efflux system membrane fusion protein